MGRGQSLIVWAIAEGRAAAAGVDRYLMGQTALPAPIRADRRAPAMSACAKGRSAMSVANRAGLAADAHSSPNNHISHTRNI